MAEVPSGYVALAGSNRTARPGARLVAPASPAEELTVSVRVRRRPGAPPLPDISGGGQLVSREEFAEIYGAGEADLEAVARFGSDHGLAEVERSTARRTVVLSGTVRSASDAFKVDLGQYETSEETYRGREGVVHVPADLAEVVEGVFGLDNRRMARRAPVSATPSAGTVPLTPREVAGLFGLSGGGAGQTIGLIEFAGGYLESDLQAFFGGLNLTTPVVTTVSVGGVTNSPGNDLDADAEVTADIEVAGSVAVGAQINVYFAAWTEQGWIDVITTAVHHNDSVKLAALSISWAWLESDSSNAWSAAGVTAVSDAFAEAGALGVTVFAGSGDWGSDGGGQHDGVARVLYPASDPFVTSCGGTSISNVSGTSFTETTWAPSGGGISTLFDVPEWQANITLPASANHDGRVGRGLPDIAGVASGYSVFISGSASVVSGTSLVAPFYAGLVAVLNNTPVGPLGYLNPRLYSWNGTNAFRDIADGVSNAYGGAPGYTSGPGWDACTGLGSINAGAFLRVLDPCKSLREDLENLSPGDFRTLAEYQHAVAYLRQQLANCERRYG